MRTSLMFGVRLEHGGHRVEQNFLDGLMSVLVLRLEQDLSVIRILPLTTVTLCSGSGQPSSSFVAVLVLRLVGALVHAVGDAVAVAVGRAGGLHVRAAIVVLEAVDGSPAGWGTCPLASGILSPSVSRVASGQPSSSLEAVEVLGLLGHLSLASGIFVAIGIEGGVRAAVGRPGSR